MHPLRSLSERLSDFPQCWWSYLWHDLSRSDWVGTNPPSPRSEPMAALVPGFVVVRCLHRDLPGEDRSPSSFAAQPKKRGRGGEEPFGPPSDADLCFCCKLAPAISGPDALRSTASAVVSPIPSVEC